MLYGAGMREEPLTRGPDFSTPVSRPRARRVVRMVVYLLLLGLACGAIWFIDRGAMVNNSRPAGTMGRP